MKTASANLQALLLGGSQWNGAFNLYTLTTVAIGVLRWTSADADVVYGADLYSAAGPVFQAGRARVTATMEVDALDITVQHGHVQLSGLPFAAAAVKGLLQGATLKVERFFGAHEAVNIFEGRVSRAEPGSTETRLVVKSAVALLGREIPRRPIQVQCPYSVGDVNCGVAMSPTHTDSLTLAGSPTTTSLPCLAAPTKASTNGVVTFTSGALAGARRTILAVLGPTIMLTDPLPSAPAAGDTLTATRGCDQSGATCFASFNNLARFGGFPELQQKNRQIPTVWEGSNSNPPSPTYEQPDTFWNVG